MRDTTIHQLNQLNAAFYAKTAHDFSSTRQSSWPGWEMLIRPPTLFTRVQSPSVLDVGCGNGRFGRFLQSQKFSHTYTGTDLDATLLQEARSHGLDVSQVDLVDALLRGAPLLPNEQSGKVFDSIVVFGVLHHIPSCALRARLLRALRELLAPQGLLTISWWRVDHHRNLTTRAIGPLTLGIEPEELEEHDLLLPWERGVSTVRYVHLALPDEQFRLIEDADLTLTHQFCADGKSGRENDYTILSR